MDRPKVRVVSYSDSGGGAFRCAYRMHRALLEIGLHSSMRVVQKLTDDPTVVAPASRFGRFAARARNSLATRLVRAVGPRDSVYRSLNVFPTGLGRELDASGVDLLHLHWICGEMISVREIGALRTPVVWTLHDEWVFRGAEHYPTQDDDDRFVSGYARADGRLGQGHLDIDRRTWERKQARWRRPMTAICPSRWLADRARQSLLLRDWRIETIPNPIDTSAWRAQPKHSARQRLGLPVETALVVFGAIGGTADPRKGGDLLRSALQELPGLIKGPWALAVFGQDAPAVPESWPAPVHYLGRLSEDANLIAAYSAADVVVLPSRLENLPNVAIEAQSCGTPVVAFAVGGIPECVRDRQTGYLASAFDSRDLAEGIAWTLADRQRHRELSVNARSFVEHTFDSGHVARRIEDLYAEVTSRSQIDCVGDGVPRGR